MARLMMWDQCTPHSASVRLSTSMRARRMVMLTGWAREQGPSSFWRPLRYSTQEAYWGGGEMLRARSGRLGSDPPIVHIESICSSTVEACTGLLRAPRARYLTQCTMRKRCLASWLATESRVWEHPTSSQKSVRPPVECASLGLLSPGGDGTAGCFETNAEITREAVEDGRWCRTQGIGCGYNCSK